MGADDRAQSLPEDDEGREHIDHQEEHGIMDKENQDGYEQVAGNSMPMSEQKVVVPVGVQVAAEGEYTFAMPEGTEGVGVVLIDNIAGTRTNLGLLDYTVYLEAGQTDGRFSLEIAPVQQITTNLEAINDKGLEKIGARKVLIEGILYIVKDGEIYDAQGRRL